MKKMNLKKYAAGTSSAAGGGGGPETTKAAKKINAASKKSRQDYYDKKGVNPNAAVAINTAAIKARKNDHGIPEGGQKFKKVDKKGGRAPGATPKFLSNTPGYKKGTKSIKISKMKIGKK
jgi:hypothetical protein